jgi:hypothetical protein
MKAMGYSVLGLGFWYNWYDGSHTVPPLLTTGEPITDQGLGRWNTSKFTSQYLVCSHYIRRQGLVKVVSGESTLLMHIALLRKRKAMCQSWNLLPLSPKSVAFILSLSTDHGWVCSVVKKPEFLSVQYTMYKMRNTWYEDCVSRYDNMQVSTPKILHGIFIHDIITVMLITYNLNYIEGQYLLGCDVVKSGRYW